MKRSEQLFSIINDIDDDIIDEAKIKEEAPVLMKPEPRSPIKSIIALAACIAVLAVGIFAIVKFKLGREMDPIQSDSSEYSSDDNSYDNSTSDDNSFPNPDIELTFTEEDRELQAILKDLTANAEEIDRLFYKMSITDGEPDINTHWYKYCLIPEGMRTEPNGRGPVPHSSAEMEELLLKYFSKRAVEFYMSEVGRASVSETANEYGEYDISFENITSSIFAEINDKLYRLQLEWEYNFSNLGIDCGTAKVTHQTDKTIEFTYWGYDRTKLSSEGGDTYSERNGAIVYEDGAWKLNYFYRSGFIPEMPNEYTEQDLELQAILETLKPGEAVQDLFRLNSVSASGDMYAFILPGDYEPEGSYQHYIDVSGPQPLVKHPKSIDELEDMLLEYFTEESTAGFMSNVCKGTMTDNGDGTYTVTIDKDVFYPVYIEIDGKMFYRTTAASGVGYDFNTAKVAEWTDDTIIFTYIASNPGWYSTETSALRFERGGWKKDPFYDPEKELKETLRGILPQARELDGMFNNLSANEKKYEFMFYGRHFGEDYPTHMETRTYYLVSDGQRTEPNGLFAVPQSRAEMEKLLLKCFSKRAIKTYMEDFSSGSITEIAGGMFIAETESGYPSTFIEADGKLFYSPYSLSRDLNFDLNTAKLISKTDKTIKFKYDTDSAYHTNEGTLVYENGGWKLNHFNYDGFIPEYPTEFSEEDEKLQEILNELSPGGVIIGWFNSAGETFLANHFVFEGLENAENYATFYVKLPTGKFAGGREEYPRSYDELTELLLKYLAQQTADWYMPRTNKGTITSSSDKNYYIKTEKPVISMENIPSVIEIDGEMYYAVHDKSGNGSAVWDTAKVTSRTDDSIEFTYLHSTLGGFYTEKGLIEFERGGWRINYYKIWFGSD